ncbi:nitroreductase family protein [Streptomyces novaecaesareae]|uniref:nitroreductase family protein n=1 Tax=Streptomyces novaecaesareae TaxID=68244 RepID=UPI00068B2DF0|nr:nitroreductase family protein [Streptomyces novaecaesareae]
MSSPHDLAGELIRAFRAPGPAVPAAARKRSTASPLGPGVRFEPEERPRTDLLTALRTRRSQRFFDSGAVPAALLADVVARGIETDVASWPDEQMESALQVDVVAFRLEGLAPGMFGLDAGRREYTPVAPLPTPEARHDLTLQWEFCESAAIVSVAADLDRVSELYGARGYRRLMGRASAAAYTMWLDAVAAGLVGTVFAGFIPASVRGPLRSDGASRHQLFALALGGAPEQPPHTPPGPTGHRVTHGKREE